MTPQKILKLVEVVLTYVDVKKQCRAIIKDDYLIEYGRTGRKTWAIEITTNADQYYVAYVYPSNNEKDPWAADVGWMPRKKDKIPKFELETTTWTNIANAVGTAITAVLETVIHDALILECEDITGEAAL